MMQNRVERVEGQLEWLVCSQRARVSSQACHTDDPSFAQGRVCCTRLHQIQLIRLEGARGLVERRAPHVSSKSSTIFSEAYR